MPYWRLSGFYFFYFAALGVLAPYWGLYLKSLGFDAVAIGQFTPGPVFTTATFVGYVLAGVPGAIVATVGIFLPAFCFVAVLKRIVPLMRRAAWTAALLDGVNVGALGLMMGVTWQLGRAAVVDWLTALLAVVSAALLFRWKINSAWLVLAGAVIGLLVYIL